MPLFRKKPELTELEVASEYVSFIAKETTKVWPSLYETLKETTRVLKLSEFVVEDENQAKYDLALAAIGANAQALWNVFPEQQANRINQWVLRILDDPEFKAPELKGYGSNEVRKYGEAFREHPGEVANRLLHRWLAKNISNYSPLLAMDVSLVMTPLVVSWSWKTFKDNYKVVKGDLPLDFKASDIGVHLPGER